MRRHINLANPALLPPKPFFQFNSMMLALGVLFLGLLLISLYINTALRDYVKQADGMQAGLAAKQGQLAQEAKNNPQRKGNPDVAARLESIQVQKGLLQRIDQTLQGGQQPDGVHISSEYLVALASQPLKGAWLTGIRINGNGVTLDGQATQAAAIPAAIKQIEGLLPFKGQHFAAFEVVHDQQTQAQTQANGNEQMAQPADVLSFTLSATAAKEVNK